MEKSKLKIKIPKSKKGLSTRNERRATGDGFTLVELLLALTVSSIVLAAVATLAFALSTATSSSDDTARKQAQLRYATLRISELLRNCKLICGTPDGDIAIWRADDNSDNQINVNEMARIQKGPDSSYLRLCEFPASGSSSVTLAQAAVLSPDDYDVTYVSLLPQCSNVQFAVDNPGVPARTRFASISFDLAENGVDRHYQISTVLRCWAGNLLNSTATALVSDDD
jgi:prepilin-type N-terminal cleavage/methylation domain-containing protein